MATAATTLLTTRISKKIMNLLDQKALVSKKNRSQVIREIIESAFDTAPKKSNLATRYLKYSKPADEDKNQYIKSNEYQSSYDKSPELFD